MKQMPDISQQTCRPPEAFNYAIGTNLRRPGHARSELRPLLYESSLCPAARTEKRRRSKQSPLVNFMCVWYQLVEVSATCCSLSSPREDTTPDCACHPRSERSTGKAEPCSMGPPPLKLASFAVPVLGDSNHVSASKGKENGNRHRPWIGVARFHTRPHQWLLGL